MPPCRCWPPPSTTCCVLRALLLLLSAAVQTGDYETMARALATIGACDTDVDYKK